MRTIKGNGIANPETLSKYKDYLHSMKTVSSFDVNAMRKKYKIGNSLNTWLIRNNVIESIGDGCFSWNNKSGIAESKLLPAYFEDYRAYSREMYRKRKAKQARIAKRQLAKGNVDVVMAKDFQRDIANIKRADAKRQQEVWTDQDAINFLKQSPTYTYEIYRIRKEQL
jgi:hypothetical protein